jgi:peptide deformylase
MAVRKIVRMGHPVLRQVARPLTDEEIRSRELRALLDDMVDTLRDYGGIGLAAPQIAESVRVAIIEIPGGQTRNGEVPALPLTTFINPVIEVVDAAARGYWEGCLSVPGLRGFVERPPGLRADTRRSAEMPRRSSSKDSARRYSNTSSITSTARSISIGLRIRGCSRSRKSSLGTWRRKTTTTCSSDAR